MAEITAAAVMALRDKTGLPMMDCKKALQQSGGDEAAAIKFLREQGIKTQSIRADRETACGRIAVYTDHAKGIGAMVEMKCESAPVANSPEFTAYVNELAKVLATTPSVKTAEELLAQPSLTKAGQTLGQVKDDMFNRIREVFNLSRLERASNVVGGYAHHDGSCGALVHVEGGNADAAKDIAMHVVAQKPMVTSKEDMDPVAVEKEREILAAAARKEGKPEAIIAKMIDGRLRNFFAMHVLNEQPFVKDDSQTVAKYAAGHKMKVLKFVRWDLGK
jgi:elongation factor Ts